MCSAFTESDAEMRIQLNAVVTEAHRDWSPPNKDEQYAHRRFDLVFPQPARVHWVERTMCPNVDPDGADVASQDAFLFGASLTGRPDHDQTSRREVIDSLQIREREDTMRQRVPLILSVTALVVAVLGSTGLGRAAGETVRAVIPFAKISGYAKQAGNSSKLNGRTCDTAWRARDDPGGRQGRETPGRTCDETFRSTTPSPRSTRCSRR